MVENTQLRNCSWECEILFSIHGWLHLGMAGFFSWCEVCGCEGPTIFIGKKSAYRWAAWFKVMLFEDHLYLLKELKLLIVSFWCCLYWPQDCTTVVTIAISTFPGPKRCYNLKISGFECKDNYTTFCCEMFVETSEKDLRVVLA